MADYRTNAILERRKYERKSLSCTECAGRKLRCSKTIPCTACVDRGKARLCHRRNNGRASLDRPPSSPHIQREATGPSVAPHDGSSEPPLLTSSNSPRRHPSEIPPARLVDGVANNFAITLEFLTLSRQRVLRLADDEGSSPSAAVPVTSRLEFDPLISEDQALAIVDYHHRHLKWMHNVVHLPTFRLQVEGVFQGQPPVDRCWPALYYSVLSVGELPWKGERSAVNQLRIFLQHSLYHIEPQVLMEMGLNDHRKTLIS